MAYITKSNARNLEFQADKSSVEKILIEDLYKLSLWMLSRKEQQWLGAARIFYVNPEFYIKHIYKKVERTGNNDLVYVAGTPAYHVDQQCKVLNSRYLNYVIPPEIAERSEATVNAFREWWKSEEVLLNSNAERFLEKMGIRWLLKNPPSLQSIEADNSGIEITENRDVSEVEDEIDRLIQSMSEIRGVNADLIDRYGKRTFAIRKGDLEINDSNEKVILDDWEIKKEDLKDRLRLFFQLRFNPDLEMKGSVLESLGFRPCAQCHVKA